MVKRLKRPPLLVDKRTAQEQWQRAGRLFHGRAPTREFNARRLALLKRWDALVKQLEIPTGSIAAVLRDLRKRYHDYNYERDGASRVMKLIEDVAEHNSEEQRASEAAKLDPNWKPW